MGDVLDLEKGLRERACHRLLQKRVELDKAVRVRMNATICFGMIAHAVDPKRLKDVGGDGVIAHSSI